MTSSKRKFNYLHSNRDEWQCDDKNFPNSGNSNEDWSGPGWYRVMGGAGTQLSSNAFTNRSRGYCQTSIGGWITGGNLQSTTVGQTVSRTIKFDRPGFEYTDYNHDISVTNCDGFFVYNLPGMRCNFRYCTQ